MGFLDFIQDAFKEPTKNDLEEVEFYISSASYCQEDIEKLVKKLQPINNRYIMEDPQENNMVVYKYGVCNVRDVVFLKEPKNKHDKNAIKIMASYGTFGTYFVGYIPQENNVIIDNDNYNVILKCLIVK